MKASRLLDYTEAVVMLDWKITETESLPDDEPVSPAGRLVSRRALWMIALAVMVGVLASLLVVRQRLDQSEATIANDLLTLAKAEEQARRFNLRERVEGLLSDNLDGTWRARYLALFDTTTGTTPTQVEMSIAGVEMQGNGVLAAVQIGDQVQQRYYELTPAGWQRAPLPMALWGDSLFTYTYPQNERIRVQYYRRDAEFAKAMMEDLPRLIATRDAMNASRIYNFAFTILPAELRGVVLEQDVRQVVVNSPELVNLSTHNRLTGEEAVRYAIARMLLSDPDMPRVDPRHLPAAPRFTNALRTVLALRWTLTPERYAQLRHTWRTPIGSDWQSPFFANPLHNSAIDPSLPSRVQAAALLVVDALYDQAGESGVVAAFHGMPTATNWDTLLTPITGQNTLRLEERAQGGTTPPVTIPALPLVGAPIMSRESSRDMPLFMVAGYPHAIELHMERGAMIEVVEGEPLPAACLRFFPEITLQGTWREEGLGFTVSGLRANAFETRHYFTATLAPSDTEAVVGVWRMGQSGRIQSLAALQSNGMVTPLLMQQQQKRLIPVTGVQGTDPDGIFLTIPADQGCPVQALVYYRAEVGIVGQWLIRTERHGVLPTILWDSESASGLLLSKGDASVGLDYWRLTADHPHLYGEAEGKLPAGTPLALVPGGEQLLLAPPVANGAATPSQRIDIANGRIQGTYPPPRWMSHATEARFAEEGNHLFVTWNGPNRYNVNGEVSTVMRYDMETGAETPFWQPNDGNLAFYIADVRAPVLYTVGSVARSGSTLQQVSATASELLWRPPSGYDLFYMVPCGEGGAMVVTIQRTLQQSIAQVPKLLAFLEPNGTLRPASAPIENGLPLLCP